MISIIVCSRTPSVTLELKQNIAATIGCDYELIVIDNSAKAYSIFSAYNEGVSRSRGDILCFMHEDILFRTKGWGTIAEKMFQDPTIGLIGVTGTHFLPQCPLYWTESPFITTTNIDKINGREYRDFKKELMGRLKAIDAVACDGQWLCVRKSLFGKICFDDIAFSGFHLYDMDICLQVLHQGLRVCVVDGIQVEHHSRGNFNEEFELALNCFYNKWKDCLPLWRGIDGIPQYSLKKINDVYRSNYIIYRKNRDVYNSKNYKLGYAVLLPFRKLIKLIRK